MLNPQLIFTLTFCDSKLVFLIGNSMFYAPCPMPYANERTELNTMTLQQMVNAIKERPDFAKVGMIACHNGVVRATSRDGRDVKGLSIEVDRDALQSIVQEMHQRSGIIEVAVHLFEGYRQIGEDVMLVAVAGDIREHVFPVLEETVERLKKEVTRKEEYFID